jgi:hypothetical protein
MLRREGPSTTFASRWLRLSITVGLMASSCKDDRPPIVWKGQHLRFGTQEDTSAICDGTLPYMDAFVGHIGELFERRNARVDYYWVPQDVGSYCVSIAGACAREAEVFSDSVLHKHELVHAARPEAYLPLEEGIAELYGDQDRWELEPVPEDVLRLLQDHQHGRFIEDHRHYKSLGHFTSYLKLIGGADSLAALSRQTAYDDSFESLDAVFQELYRLPLEDVIERYVDTYPVCDQTRHVSNDFDCGRNVVHLPAQGGEPLDLSIAPDCDDPDVLGPPIEEVSDHRSGELQCVVSGRENSKRILAFSVWASVAGTSRRYRPSRRQCSSPTKPLSKRGAT